jgi:hypothetical protein
MKPLTDEDRKRLTLYLGECWHEWKGPNSNFCSKCDKYAERNRTFTTYEDLGKLKDKLVENGEWGEFCEWVNWSFDNSKTKWWNAGQFSKWLINPDRCGLVAEYLKQKEGK